MAAITSVDNARRAEMKNSGRNDNCHTGMLTVRSPLVLRQT